MQDRFDKACFASVGSLLGCARKLIVRSQLDDADALVREARRRGMEGPHLDWIEAAILSEHGVQQPDIKSQVECYRQTWQFLATAAARFPRRFLACKAFTPWAIPGYLELLKASCDEVPPDGEGILETLRALRGCGIVEEYQRQAVIAVCQEIPTMLEHWSEAFKTTDFMILREANRALHSLTASSPFRPSDSRLASAVRNVLLPFSFNTNNEYLDDAPLLEEVRLSADALMKRLLHRDKGIRARAAAILGARRVEQALDRLWHLAQRDGDRAVRSMAIVAIAESVHAQPTSHRDTEGVAAHMLEMLESDRSQDGRIHAAKALGILGCDTPEIQAGLLDALFSDDKKMKGARIGVIEAIGRLGYHDARVRKRLIECFNEDTWRHIKLAVVHALGRFSQQPIDPDGAEEIVAVLGQILMKADPDWLFSPVVEAIRKWGRRANVLVEPLLAMCPSVDDFFAQLHKCRVTIDVVELYATILHVAELDSEEYDLAMTALELCLRAGPWSNFVDGCESLFFEDPTIYPKMIQAGLVPPGPPIFGDTGLSRFTALKAIFQGPVDTEYKQRLLIDRMWLDWVPEIRAFAAQALIQLDDQAASIAEAWQFLEVHGSIDERGVFERIWSQGNDH